MTLQYTAGQIWRSACPYSLAGAVKIYQFISVTHMNIRPYGANLGPHNFESVANYFRQAMMSNASPV